VKEIGRMTALRTGTARALALIGALWIAFAPSSADDRSFYAGVPIRAGYPNPITLLDNGAFVVGYDEIRRVPAWVAYRLFPNPGTFSFSRPSRFSIDERTRARISHDDYTNTGFSRGHMAPNFAIMTRYGREAQLATFTMSNIVPQRQALNGGPWENLESMIANDFAENLEEVWVITGPIFDDILELFAESSVEIPDQFYKIVVDEENGQPRSLAFIMNEDTRSPAKLEDFLVSIDAIETVAGFDFFPGLDDDAEEDLESDAADDLWDTAGAPPIPSPPATELTNVNTAPSEDLELLPGVGPVLAQRIIQGRPYASVDDLLRVNGIGPATLERLRSLVTVAD
jgi:endonuclease G, mitochondrial